MKKLILILFWELTIFCNGQVVDSVSFYPINPTTNDTISILCYVQYPNIGCPVQEKSFSLVNDSIILRAFHCGGWQTMICYTVDTFLIPPSNLSPGTYKIYYMPGFVTEFPCQFPTDSNGNPPPYPFAIYTKEIIVSSPLDIISEISNNFNIEINPNPSNCDFTVEFEITDNSPVQFTIYDYTGKQIKQIQKQQLPYGKYLEKIRTDEFSNGLYFLSANFNGKIQTFKIIKI